MRDTIRVSLATFAILALMACCFIGFYLAIEWASDALARAGWI